MDDAEEAPDPAATAWEQDGKTRNRMHKPSLALLVAVAACQPYPMPVNSAEACGPGTTWDGTQCVAGPPAPVASASTAEPTTSPGGHHRHHPGATHVADRYWVGPAATSDDQTSLEWARETSRKEMPWDEARSFCAHLEAGGGRWRLPRADELSSIVARGRAPAVIPEAFPDTAADYYWTATPSIGRIMKTVSFATGEEDSRPSGLSAFARCVRSAQH